MKVVYLLILVSSFTFSVGSCSPKKQTHSIDNNDIKNDTTTNITSNINVENDTVNLYSNASAEDLINCQHFDLNKLYTDTVVFQQYMDYGDFNRFHVIARGKNLYPLNSDDSRSLNRGDIAILKWKVDSIWNPDNPKEKWLSSISVSINKTKDGKLSLFKKKYQKPIDYYFSEDIAEKYSKEDFDEIYDLVQYYLANSKKQLVISAIKNKSDFEKIQYSIEEQQREENGISNIYTVIGISNHFESHNSIIQWLYLKQSDYGYRIIYEYDLPNDRLVLFN